MDYKIKYDCTGDEDQDFINIMKAAILKYKIDPEYVPALMHRLYLEEFELPELVYAQFLD